MSPLALIAFLCSFLAIAQGLPEPRIVGGSDAMPGQFPHQISLRQDGSHICGGSIISANFILTAAHCVGRTMFGKYQPTNPRRLSVRAGSNNRIIGGVVRLVDSVKVHENYSGVYNDVALIKLRVPLVLSEAIQAIPLASSKTPDNSSVIISGWGRTENDGPIPFMLQWNILLSISKEKCAKEIGVLTDKLICLSHKKDNGACNGDSGGPAVFNNELVGVAGFVIRKCGTSKPDGYANTFHHSDWIKENSDLNKSL